MMIWLLLAVALTGCRGGGGPPHPPLHSPHSPTTDEWRPEVLRSGICVENKTLPCCKDVWTKFEKYRDESWVKYMSFASCSGDGNFESLQCNDYAGCRCVDKLTGEWDGESGMGKGTKNCDEGVDVCAKLKVQKLDIMKNGICANRSKTDGPPCCQALWEKYEWLCKHHGLMDVGYDKQCTEDGNYRPKQCYVGGFCYCVDKNGKFRKVDRNSRSVRPRPPGPGTQFDCVNTFPDYSKKPEEDSEYYYEQ